MIKPFLLKHKMHMAWSPTMPPKPFQQLPHRPIVRDRIRHRHNRLEPKQALLIAQHNCPAVRLVAPVLVLHVILSVAVCFPDVNLDAGQGRARGGFHGAQDEQRRAGGVGRDVGSGRQRGRVVSVKRAEDGAFSGGGRLGVVDGVDEEGEADDVAEEDKFLEHGCQWIEGCGGRGVGGLTYLSHICTYLADLCEELDPGHPFIEAQSCFARKVVEVRDEALHNVLEAWIAALRVYAMDVLGDVFDGEVFELGDLGGCWLASRSHAGSW